MKTRTFFEEAAIMLRGDSYNGGHDYYVTWQQLRNANVGETWASFANCDRAMIEEDLTVVYKDDNGCATLLRTEVSDDSPDPVHTENVELIWFEFNNNI